LADAATLEARPDIAAKLEKIDREYINACKEVAQRNELALQRRREYFDLPNESLRTYVLPYLESERARLIADLSEIQAKLNYADGASIAEKRQDLSTINNFIDRRGRWHPEAAVLYKTLGAYDDYVSVYQFPCCGEYAKGNGHIPSQFRDDGCQDAPT
jgi:hypothetical protein